MKLITLLDFPSGSVVENLAAMQETQVQSLGWEDPLEKEMATHSSVLVWRFSWTEKSGRLQSDGVARESDNLVTKHQQQQSPFQDQYY